MKFDDISVKPLFDSSDDPIEKGDYAIWRTIALADMKSLNITDFKEMTFTFYVKLGNNEVIREGVKVMRDGFVKEE